MPPQAQGNGNTGTDGNDESWFGGNLKTIILIVALMYFFRGASQPAGQSGPGEARGVDAVLRPAIAPGTPLELAVYISESERCDFDSARQIWHQKGLLMGGFDERLGSIRLKATPGMQNNGSLYAHTYLYHSGGMVTPQTLHNHPQFGVEQHFNLVRHMPKRITAKRKNLLADGTETETEAAAATGIVGADMKRAEREAATPKVKEVGGHWLPNMTLAVIEEFTSWRIGGIPPHVKPYIMPLNDGSYQPILFKHDFWATRDQYIILNETVTDLDLHLELRSMASWKWQLFLQMEQSFEMQKNFGADGSETDEFKHMLLDNNWVVLTITFAVSILHSVFEFLAFKNDIAFWKNTKSMEGLSVKSIFIQLFSQVVIFLYLLDHEDTSWMIIIPAAIGIAIECWKITKAVIVQVKWENGWPKMSMTDRDTYRSKTKDIDDKAMTYLSYMLVPLFIGYAIYSLYYESHKSWYSWVLGSLTGAIYTFGFIMMTPQLFINYKLKSVAHLPWRVFVYKAINTFIDDLFAWVIRMPTMHRLATLRDDVIFVIYLYQRWLYRVDMTRANEYGQVMVQPSENEAASTVGTGEAASATAPVPEPMPEAPEAKDAVEKKND